MEKPNSNIAVAFTGHREYNGGADNLLMPTIERLYKQGYRQFLSGMAVGFDIAAAEAVLECAKEHNDIQLWCIEPFAGFEDGRGREQIEQYRNILAQSTFTITLSQSYLPWVFHSRNDFLVDNCSIVIAYYKPRRGVRSGTGYTIRRAKKQKKPIINLAAIDLMLDL